MWGGFWRNSAIMLLGKRNPRNRDGNEVSILAAGKSLCLTYDSATTLNDQLHKLANEMLRTFELLLQQQTEGRSKQIFNEYVGLLTEISKLHLVNGRLDGLGSLMAILRPFKTPWMPNAKSSPPVSSELLGLRWRTQKGPVILFHYFIIWDM